MAPTLVNGLDKSAPVLHRATMLKTCGNRFEPHFIAIVTGWEIGAF